MLRPQTLIGQMQGFRRVPFFVRAPVQTATAGVGWVGEAKAAEASELAFEAQTFGHSKVGGIVMITRELAESSDPSAEEVIRRDMIAAVAEFQDDQFLDPSVTAVAQVKPASVTSAGTDIPSTGDGANAVVEDLRDLVNAVTTNGQLFLVMRRSTVIHLAMLGSDDRTFRNVTAFGGSI